MEIWEDVQTQLGVQEPKSPSIVRRGEGSKIQTPWKDFQRFPISGPLVLHSWKLLMEGGTEEISLTLLRHRRAWSPGSPRW